MTKTVFAVLVAAVFSTTLLAAILLPVLKRIALDQPNHRSSHVAPTPRGGGLAVIGGTFVASLVLVPVLDARAWAILLAAVAATLLGAVDDLRPQAPLTRLILTGLFAAVTAAVISTHEYSALSVYAIFSTVFIVGYTNAFNFMDGINGISALNAAVSALWLAFLAHHEGLDGAIVIGLALAGSALAFLPWNAPRAHVFLGDAGSYGMGFTIGALAVYVWIAGAPILSVVAPLFLYILDTLSTLFRRVVRGETWHEAHREHIYQRLVDGHLSHLQSALTVAGLSAMCAVSAWLVQPYGSAPLAIVLLLVGALYLVSPKLLTTAVVRTGE